MAMPHQLGQRAHAKLGLELSASIGNRLVAHMQMFGDSATGLAFEPRVPGLAARTVMRFQPVGGASLP